MWFTVCLTNKNDRYQMFIKCFLWSFIKNNNKNRQKKISQEINMFQIYSQE